MNSKEKIAETAFQLFTQNGYKATSISQLVTNSGLSKGAFYHYFESKKAVYEYVIETFFLSFYKNFDWILFEKLDLTETKKSLTEMYIGFITQIKEMTQNNPSKYFILFFEAYNNLDEFKEAIQEFYTTFKTTLTNKIKTTKNITENRAELEAMQLIAKFEGLFFWFSVFPNENIHKYLNN